MPERPRARKEQCCSHPSARDGEVGLDSDLGIAQSRIHWWLPTEYTQHDLHWHFPLAFLPMENHSQPAHVQPLVLLKPSVTLSLSSLYNFPAPLLLRAGLNVYKSPAHPCLHSGTQSRSLGHCCTRTFCLLCVYSLLRNVRHSQNSFTWWYQKCSTLPFHRVNLDQYSNM